MSKNSRRGDSTPHPSAIERKRIRLRRLKLEDFDQFTVLQKACFPGMKPYRKEQIEAQLSRFPEGQFVIEYEGRIVASCGSLIVDYSDYSEWHDWRVISDTGMLGTHDPAGDTLYGIEIMVHPDFRGMKLSRRLYEARKKLARDHNLARIVIAGRIPGYGEHADKMTARQYVDRVVEKKFVDPVLTPQLANGFVLQGLIPDYLPEDSESRGYATHLEWVNLDHQQGKRMFVRNVHPARISVVQYEMRRIASFADFRTQCEYFIDIASDSRSDFVVFPELFALQLLSTIPNMRPAMAARKLAEQAPKILEFMTHLAVKFNINIIAGSVFRLDGEDVKNTSWLIRRDGTVEGQDKIHITPNERKWWGISPGDRLQVFSTDTGKIAILICYDVEFPELARLAAHDGAQILFVPFNTNDQAGYLRVRHCAQARCVENHVYTVISGCVGNLPSVANADIHYAGSAILTPSDIYFSREGVAASCPTNIEMLVTQDLDLSLLKRARQSGTVQNWNDRRRDLYKVTFAGADKKTEV